MKKFLTIISLLALTSLTVEAALPTATLVGVTNASFASGGPQAFASVNPNSLATTYHFNYGLTTNYGSSTTVSNIGSSSSAILVSNVFPYLSPNTVYHYQVVGVNASGTTNSPDGSFTNYAVGVVSYYALYNFLTSNLLSQAQFNTTNGFPFSLTNAFTNFDSLQFIKGSDGLTHIVSGANITNISLVTPSLLNGDGLVGNSYSAIVGSFVTNNMLATNGASLVAIYTNLSDANSLFSFDVYQSCTATGAGGNTTCYVKWQDENGLFTNNLITAFSLTATSSHSTSIVIHSLTNTPITLILSNNTVSGSPAINIYSTLKKSY